MRQSSHDAPGSRQRAFSPKQRGQRSPPHSLGDQQRGVRRRRLKAEHDPDTVGSARQVLQRPGALEAVVSGGQHASPPRLAVSIFFVPDVDSQGPPPAADEAVHLPPRRHGGNRPGSPPVHACHGRYPHLEDPPEGRRCDWCRRRETIIERSLCHAHRAETGLGHPGRPRAVRRRASCVRGGG